jgi:hypothetical protein
MNKNGKDLWGSFPISYQPTTTSNYPPNNLEVFNSKHGATNFQYSLLFFDKQRKCVDDTSKVYGID